MTPAEKARELATLARYCVTKSPGFAAIALWVPYSASEDTDYVAYTDGKKVVVGEKFWEYAPLERAYILCHEILHVALRHIARGAQAYRVSAEHGRLWNIACDAVINRALDGMGWLQNPGDGVNILEVIDDDQLEKRPPASWSAEEIYTQVLDQIGLPPDEEGMEEWIKKWLDAQGKGADMRPGHSEGESSDDIASRIWAARLARAQAGDRAGGLLRALARDFPTARTPWPQILRAFMQDAVLPKSRENWNRPSRRVLSGTSEFFEPATGAEYGIRRAAVVVDTSGSINDAVLTRFCAEITAVQKRTGCELILMAADSDIRSEVVVKNDGRSLLDKVREGLITFKGGGGTDFRPAIARLNVLQVHVALYFTDMAGVFGTNAPQMPLLWCSTAPNATAPFGRVVYLDALTASTTSRFVALSSPF